MRRLPPFVKRMVFLQKNPRAHKNKIGAPPPKYPSSPNTPPPPQLPHHPQIPPPPRKPRNFMGMEVFFSCRKKPKIAGTHKIGATTFSPRIAGETFYGHEAFSDFFLFENAVDRGWTCKTRLLGETIHAKRFCALFAPSVVNQKDKRWQATESTANVRNSRTFWWSPSTHSAAPSPHFKNELFQQRSFPNGAHHPHSRVTLVERDPKGHPPKGHREDIRMQKIEIQANFQQESS